MGVVLTFSERAKINRKVRLGTRCVAVGRSGEVPLLEVFNNGSIYGRHSVPCVMAVVESLAALRRPAVERFHCTALSNHSFSFMCFFVAGNYICKQSG